MLYVGTWEENIIRPISRRLLPVPSTPYTCMRYNNNNNFQMRRIRRMCSHIFSFPSCRCRTVVEQIQVQKTIVAEDLDIWRRVLQLDVQGHARIGRRILCMHGWCGSSRISHTCVYVGLYLQYELSQGSLGRAWEKFRTRDESKRKDIVEKSKKVFFCTYMDRSIAWGNN